MGDHMGARSPEPEQVAEAVSGADLAAEAEDFVQQWLLGTETRLLEARLRQFHAAIDRHLAATPADPRARELEELCGHVDRLLAGFAGGGAIAWLPVLDALKRLFPDITMSEREEALFLVALSKETDEGPLVKWTAALELGIPWIDKQHRALVATLNEIGRLPPDYDLAEADALLDRLRRLAWHNFHEEEAHLPAGVAANEHAIEHRRLLAELDRLMFDVRARRVDLLAEARDRLCPWLIEHIGITDRADFGPTAEDELA